MRLSILGWFCLFLVSFASAQTKLILHDAASTVQYSPSVLVKRANNTQGTAATTAVLSTIVGPVTGQYWPTSTTGHIWTKTAGGTPILWMSDPLSAAVTLSGTVTPNLWGLESGTGANLGFGYEIMRWSALEGGIVSSLGSVVNNGATEWGTTAAVRTAPTLALTATAFSPGDRIVIVIYNDDAAGVTEGAGGRTGTLRFDGTLGSTSDSYFTFTQTFTFAADTNNQPDFAQAD
jgi:hypothetical protein